MTSSKDAESNRASIKIESLHGEAPSPQNSPLKRQHEDGDENGYKRPRIETSSNEARTGDALNHILAQSDVPAPSGQPLYQSPVDSSHSSAKDGTLPQAPNGFWDPHRNMRIRSLEIVNNLSTQILATLAQEPWEDTIKIITEPDNEIGQAYYAMKSLFDQTKKIYAHQDEFLSADKLGLTEDDERDIIRRTNLATFVSEAFAGAVGFYSLNHNFIEIFLPRGKSLSKELGILFLKLKTQACLSGWGTQEKQESTHKELLYEIFPDDMEITLLSRHPGQGLSPSEKEFIEDFKKQRAHLLSDGGDVESIQKLSNMYPWEDFLYSLSEHLRVVYGSLIAPYMERHAPSPQTQPVPDFTPSYNPEDLDGFALAAERIVQKAAQDFIAQLQRDSESSRDQNGELIQEQKELKAPYPATVYMGTTIPVHPSQSAPTQVLYEKARQAAVAKSNTGNARPPGLPSQRRPWSQEEEGALMAGLDLVKGPHWSQILALYGPEGTVSHILKERNQVQLKDKARNLKLFFLKSSVEVPHYLRSVTGELKTRAPSQAARKEAERVRQASSDEQLRMNGIMALNSIKDQSPASEEEAGSMSPASDITLLSAEDVESQTESSQDMAADARLRQQLSAHNNDASL